MPELRWRSSAGQRFAELADEMNELGLKAVGDAKLLTDLRSLHRYLGRVAADAALGSPEVAERKRQGRISYLQGEIARLRDGGEMDD